MTDTYVTKTAFPTSTRDSSLEAPASASFGLYSFFTETLTATQSPPQTSINNALDSSLKTPAYGLSSFFTETLPTTQSPPQTRDVGISIALLMALVVMSFLSIITLCLVVLCAILIIGKRRRKKYHTNGRHTKFLGWFKFFCWMQETI